MHPARALEYAAFGTGDPLDAIGSSTQVQYLRRYLDDLKATSILVEPNYFDRDYLAEFAAFYSTSSAGYKNICRRLHFFSTKVDRGVLAAALGDPSAHHDLQENYLGFVVQRPIPASPLGRTVLRWYEDPHELTTPRIVEPARYYACHVAGLQFQVRGLAWQQQDSAVGTCATISLWSMLHSSALVGHHGLPTTASVTRAAHKTASLGARVFPSAGLGLHHLCEAIKEHDLQPVVVPGDVQINGASVGFTRERFAASCAALIRSGYPVLVLGSTAGGRHAVCAVGFRSAIPPQASAGTVVNHDADIPVLYLHDDNIGPSVRFRIDVDPQANSVILRAEAPPTATPSVYPDPTVGRPPFIPTTLVSAVPDDLRTTPDQLHKAAIAAATPVSLIIQGAAQQVGMPATGLTISARFSRLRDYLGRDLDKTLGTHPARLAAARLALTETVPPMSLHVSVVRIGSGANPLFDILYDTTDNERQRNAFAHVVFVPGLAPLLGVLASQNLLSLGVQVDAT